jgi:hypothetical protein
MTTDPDSIRRYLRRLSDDVTTIKEAQSILSQRMTSLEMRLHGLETAILGVRSERRTGLIEQE